MYGQKNIKLLDIYLFVIFPCQCEYVVAVTVQVGTFLRPTQVLVIRDLLNLCCQP